MIANDRVNNLRAIAGTLDLIIGIAALGPFLFNLVVES